MLSRRDFLGKSLLTAGFLSVSPFSKLLASEDFKRFEKLTPSEAATDEDFWKGVREAYGLSKDFIYLNNAGVNPQPTTVQEAETNGHKFANEAPTYTMWRRLDDGREPLRAKLAEMAGCSAEEIAINRNSTEGLNTIIFGLNLKAGDEVVLSNFDYPNMLNAWRQRELREGIKLVWIEDFIFPVEDDQQMVEAYTKAITSKTKIVHITHLINWTGQIVPVRKITDMAHQKGCEVIVDGAQSFGQIEFKISDLDCDYFATSLHKWLGAPFGTGMMYVKKEKIKNIWALLSAPDPATDNIRKFENLGTRSTVAEMVIDNAIDFHKKIGGARKEARLRYLKDYWCNKIKDMPKVKIYTSMLPQFACGLATFQVMGWPIHAMSEKLFDDKMVVTAITDYHDVNGIRISPNVFTSLEELDKLVQCVDEMAKTDPPPPRPHKN
jgi:selenocysteine lyase/cysteine desulfurase